MSKPWDNELHPQTDLAQAEMSEFIITAVHVDFARELERRLRHAERLLEDVLGDATIFYEEKTLNRIANHMEAARQEDGR